MKGSKNPGKHYSKLQEVEIAKFLGGKIQPNSGGTKFGGGDVHTRKFFIEAKTKATDSKSFSIKKEWIEKCSEQAFEQNKSYCSLAFRFSPDGEDYFVIDKNLMRLLVKTLEEEM